MPYPRKAKTSWPKNLRPFLSRNFMSNSGPALCKSCEAVSARKLRANLVTKILIGKPTPKRWKLIRDNLNEVDQQRFGTSSLATYESCAASCAGWGNLHDAPGRRTDVSATVLRAFSGPRCEG